MRRRAYQGASVGAERFRTEGGRSGVAVIRGRSLFAQRNVAKWLVTNELAGRQTSCCDLPDCPTPGVKWRRLRRRGLWGGKIEEVLRRKRAIQATPVPSSASQGVMGGREAEARKWNCDESHRSFWSVLWMQGLRTNCAGHYA